MDGQDLEFEEFSIAEAVGLAFHGLDFIVDAFERAGRDRVIVPGEDAVLMFFEGVGEFEQHGDA